MVVRQRRIISVQKILSSQEPRFKTLRFLSIERDWRDYTVKLQSKHPNIESLRTAIKATFVSMDRAALQRACERFRHRLAAFIQEEGRYIDKVYSLWTYQQFSIKLFSIHYAVFVKNNYVWKHSFIFSFFGAAPRIRNNLHAIKNLNLIAKNFHYNAKPFFNYFLNRTKKIFFNCFFFLNRTKRIFFNQCLLKKKRK